MTSKTQKQKWYQKWAVRFDWFGGYKFLARYPGEQVANFIDYSFDILKLRITFSRLGVTPATGGRA